MIRTTSFIPKSFTRSLFNQSNKNSLVKFNEKDNSFEHEYSIRPDTFAFKVSAAQERSRSLDNSKVNITPTENKISPFQRLKSNNFNVLDFIYRNSTNYPFDDKSPQEVFNEYPSTNSQRLSRSPTRPRKVKMPVSDFIEDSLYNPHYGYFTREVEIFHAEKPFDYNNIEDVDGFLENWQQAYAKYDETEISPENKRKELISPDKQNYADPKSKFASASLKLYNEEKQNTKPLQSNKRSLQLWHTPTELFQPYYGEAIARYLLTNYKLNGHYPYHDLIIYEMGGGNGTLMCNILNYIKNNDRDVYKRTQYKIIEILSQLAVKQYSSALKSKLVKQGLDSTKCEIINRSIFKWDKIIEEPCFFLALEVFDNFAHDLIRYDNKTGEPHEGHVLIDKKGDFFEFFTPELNYYTNAYLTLRENGNYSFLKESTTIRGKLQAAKSLIPFLPNKDKIHPLHLERNKLHFEGSIMPFKDNLSPGEFIPTRLLQFFQLLNHKFPNHSLIASDFNQLPNGIKGYYNSPVVQTVLKDKMVDVTTYMTHQGFFDIMFPTDFNVNGDIYKQITGKVPSVELHREFLQQWSDIDSTTTKNGDNPMLDFYTNVSFMTS